MSKAMVVNTLISTIGGAVVGGAITYFTVKKTIQARADKDIEDVKQRYALLRKDDGGVTIFGAAGPSVRQDPDTIARGREFVESFGYGQTSDDFAPEGGEPLSTPAPPANTSIFNSNHPTDNPGPELDGPHGKPIEPANVIEINDDEDNPLRDYPMAQRIEEKLPYIISVEEYFNTEEEWDKDSLSYYEGDDTLIDEREKIVDNRDKYIGDIHLNMFGIKSNDRSVVYVRSPQISTDFEIIHEEGKFAVRVLGQPDPDEEEKRPPRKMRPSD